MFGGVVRQEPTGLFFCETRSGFGEERVRLSPYRILADLSEKYTGVCSNPVLDPFDPEWIGRKDPRSWDMSNYK